MNFDSLFGGRLKEERVRLDLNQAEAGNIAGVSREMWGKYERGAVPGADVLAALAGYGADVMYILTGTRSAALPGISPRQRALLDNYEHSDESGKSIIEGTASLAAESAQVKKA